MARIFIMFVSVVEDYGFEDHKPPQFQSIGLFCQEVSNYLKNPENVAVIHCKAGKVCIFLFQRFQAFFQSIVGTESEM